MSKRKYGYNLFLFYPYRIIHIQSFEFAFLTEKSYSLDTFLNRLCSSRNIFLTANTIIMILKPMMIYFYSLIILVYYHNVLLLFSLQKKFLMIAPD